MATINKEFEGWIKQAQEMQQHMLHIQEEINKLVVTGSAGQGLVEILVNGQHKVTDIRLSNTLRDNIAMIEDLVAAAYNDATQKLEKTSKEKINALLASLNLPSDLMGGNT